MIGLLGEGNEFNVMPNTFGEIIITDVLGSVVWV